MRIARIPRMSLQISVSRSVDCVAVQWYSADAHLLLQSTPSRRTSLRMTIRPSPNITPVKPAPVVMASPSSFSSSSSEGQTSDEEISDLLISPRQAATFPLPPSPDESTFPSQTSPTQPSHLAQVAAQPLTPIAPARLPTSLARRHSLREKVLIRSAVKAHHNRGLVRSASLGSSPSRPLFASGMVRSQSTGSVIAGDEDSDSSSDEEVPLVRSLFCFGS